MRKEAKRILLNVCEHFKEDAFICGILRKLMLFAGDISELDVHYMMNDGEPTPESVDEDGISLKEFIDARVCSLQFKDFRAFPDEKYGISFCRKEDDVDFACSLFLVGGNSNGKSTICDALEYAYTGDVASVHRLKGVDLKKYLTFGFEDGRVRKEDVRLILKTKGKDEPSTLNLISPISPICTSACFCSDNDVEELVRSEEYIEGYLLRQLGYGELILLEEKLSELAKQIDDNLERIRKTLLSSSDIRKVINAYLKVYHSEAQQKKVKLMLRGQALSKLVKEIRASIIHKPGNLDNQKLLSNIRAEFRRIPVDYFEEEWNQLINNIIIQEQSIAQEKSLKRKWMPYPPEMDSERNEGVKTDPVEDLQKKLIRLYERLNHVLEETDGLDNIYKELNEASSNYGGLSKSLMPDEIEELSFMSTKMKLIANQLGIEIEKVCSGFHKEHHEYLATTMNGFSPSSESFELVNAGGHLTARIKSDMRGGFIGSPKSYYNTFRFKLFVIALKISLAFLYMRTSKTIVPIVIDDVFNATDFDNSIKLERFVYHIYHTYEEKVKSGIPLQLIVFTHDEMVMTAFRKGAKLICEQELSLNRRNQTFVAGNRFICGRLFHYTQADEIKKYTQDSEDFCNLYLTI